MGLFRTVTVKNAFRIQCFGASDKDSDYSGTIAEMQVSTPSDPSMSSCHSDDCKKLSEKTRYNTTFRARSSMDRIRVSEALDTGSIPVGRASILF